MKKQRKHDVVLEQIKDEVIDEIIHQAEGSREGNGPFNDTWDLEILRDELNDHLRQIQRIEDCWNVKTLTSALLKTFGRLRARGFIRVYNARKKYFDKRVAKEEQ